MLWTKPGKKQTETLPELQSSPQPAPASAASWGQTRLDLIAHYPKVRDPYFKSYTKWWLRFTFDPETYTSAALKEQLYSMGAEIAALEKQCQDLPKEAPAEPSLKLWMKTRRLRGQQQAIEEVLGMRERTERLKSPTFSLKTPSSPPGQSAAPSSKTTPATNPIPDPFQDE